MTQHLAMAAACQLALGVEGDRGSDSRPNCAVNRGSSRRVAEPFLRWAGGKRNLIGYLLDYVPTDVHDRTYWEPFLGAGSLFFALTPRRAKLSDANRHLIDCFRHVRMDPRGVYRHLQHHIRSDSSEHYYQTRDEYNRAAPSVAQAARFIYLNKASYNGIFRVNKKGEYNVPYGKNIKPPKFPERSHLEAVSLALQGAELRCASYEIPLAQVRRGDFVYLDPPYPPLNGVTAKFVHYTSSGFPADQQQALARVVKALDAKGALVMMSNADTELIRELYSGFNLHQLSVTRRITCKSVRHQVAELVITNY